MRAILMVFLVMNSLLAFSQKYDTIQDSTENAIIFRSPKQIETIDSIVTSYGAVILKSTFYCDSNVYFKKKDGFFLKGNPKLKFNDLLYTSISGQIDQTIEFVSQDDKAIKIVPSKIFKLGSISESLVFKTKDSIDCIFTDIYLLQGKKESLFFIKDWWLLSNELLLLYNIKGELLWWYLVSKPCNPCHSSGELKEVLKMYGIKSNIFLKRDLKGIIKISSIK